MSYQILKQQFPTDPSQGQPAFLVIDVWASKLTDDDMEFIFNTLEEAESKKAELEAADTTTRIYKIMEI
jgi:hypothetical protein